jgi:co-chaperonin GroES (HSP10)
MSTPVVVKSRFLEGGTRIVRPVGRRLIVRREPAIQSYGVIIAVSGNDTVDITTSEVLSVSDDADVRTRNGPVQVGQKVLAVRVVNKRSDSLETRDEGGDAISFLAAEHVLATIDDDAITPCNDFLLIEANEDRRMVGSIMLVGAENTMVQSCKIVSTGPDVKHGEPGEYAVAPKISGVALDAPGIRRRFGGGLKILKERSMYGVSIIPTSDSPECESWGDSIDDREHRALVDRR